MTVSMKRALSVFLVTTAVGVVALGIVARTARIEPPVAHDGIERVGGPEAARLGRLHVVVPVDQNGRRIGPARAQLARAERVAVARQHLAAAAGRDDALAGPFGSSPAIRGVAAARGDRRDAQPVAELVEKRVRQIGRAHV